MEEFQKKSPDQFLEESRKDDLEKILDFEEIALM